MKPVFVVTGPSGAGKGTLIRGLLERLPQLEAAISATTRPMRASAGAQPAQSAYGWSGWHVRPAR